MGYQISSHFFLYQNVCNDKVLEKGNEEEQNTEQVKTWHSLDVKRYLQKSNKLLNHVKLEFNVGSHG